MSLRDLKAFSLLTSCSYSFNIANLLMCFVYAVYFFLCGNEIISQSGFLSCVKLTLSIREK